MLFSLCIVTAGFLWSSGPVAAAPAAILVDGVSSQQKVISLERAPAGGAPTVAKDGRKVLEAWVRRTCYTCDAHDRCDLGGLHTTPTAFDSQRTRSRSSSSSTTAPPSDDEDCVVRIQRGITTAIQTRVAEAAAAAGRADVSAAVAELTYLAYIRQRLDELFPQAGPPRARSPLEGRDSAVRYVRQVSDTARLFQLYQRAQPEGANDDDDDNEKQSRLDLELEWLQYGGGSGSRAASASEWTTFAAHAGLSWHRQYQDPTSPGLWLRFDSLAASLETALRDADPQQCPPPQTELEGLALRALNRCTRHISWLRGLVVFGTPIPPEMADGYNMARLMSVGPTTDLAETFEYFMRGGAGGRYFTLFKRCPALE